jgi:tetratricopeptide (TPR) repeat protein
VPIADLDKAEKLLRDKQAARAVEILARARDSAPDNEHIHDLLAEASMATGDLRTAEKEYEWLRSRQADFAYGKELVSVYRALAEDSLKGGASGEAEERLLKALEIAPNDGGLHWKLAQALAGSGKFQKALEEAAATKTLQPGEVSGAAMAGLYAGYARYLLGQGQCEQASAAFEEAQKLQPSLDLTPDMADLNEAYGRLAQRSGQHAAAERSYRKVLALDPKRWQVRRELAAVYEQTGQYDKAVEELEKVAESGKEGAPALKEIARIQETYLGNGAKAVTYYRRYLATRPKAADAAEVEKKLKAAEREKEQIVEYEQAIKRSPASAPNHYNLGVLLQRQGKYREAIEAYRKAIAFEPANAQAHFNLGYSYDRLRMYEEAIAEYQKAIQYKPDYLKAYSNLGAIYKDKKWYGKAIAAFQRALQIDPNYAQAHLGLGAIYAESLRDRQKATYHYQQYLRLQPSGTYAPQVRAWLGGRG